MQNVVTDTKAVSYVFTQSPQRATTWLPATVLAVDLPLVSAAMEVSATLENQTGLAESRNTRGRGVADGKIEQDRFDRND